MRLIENINFSKNEIEMLNRYYLAKNRDTLSSHSIALLDDYGQFCWSKNILKLMLLDIDLLTNDLDSLSNAKYRNILINISNFISKLDGLLSADSGGRGENSTSIFIAISAIWINYCTCYGNSECTYLLPSHTKGLLLNERVLQCAICSEYFNSVYAVPTGKIKTVYQFYSDNYQNHFRVPLDEDLSDDMDIKLLMSLMRYTHFSYMGPMGKLTSIFRIQ